MKKQLVPTSRRWVIPVDPFGWGCAVASLVVMFGLSACDKQDDKTFGQKLDSAIAKTTEAAAQAKTKTEQSAAQAKVKTEETFANAGAALKSATQKAESTVKEVAGKANEKMDDFAITTAVSSAIAKDTELSLLKIKVETREGIVTLEGTAATEISREKAGALAKTTRGVHSVDNKLIVKPG